MTSQTLISKSLPSLSNVPNLASQPNPMSTAATAIRPSSNAELSSAPACKLPYQATHQVELLHLQAETEALFQQLQVLKQQRSDLSDSLQASS